jgi:hypothetical protein
MGLFCYYKDMPTVNAFYFNEEHADSFNNLNDELKEFVAEALTCGDITLDSNEVSVRLIKVSGSGMLADIELEITAHAFDERIKKQDVICLDVRKFLKDKLAVNEIRVWLLLPQLGHSWE